MFPAAQSLIVALIVGACAGYTLWALLPSAGRRRLAGSALRLPLPVLVLAALRRAAQAATGCACDGCEHASPRPAVGSAQRVTFHPRLRR